MHTFAHSALDKAGTGVMQAERTASAEHVAAGRFPSVPFDVGATNAVSAPTALIDHRTSRQSNNHVSFTQEGL